LADSAPYVLFSLVQIHRDFIFPPRPTLSFIVDRETVGNFDQPLPPGDGFLYDYLVFATDTLSDTNHTLTIQNGHSGGSDSTVYLDYITYL
jgi:hypothetical protein